MARVTKEAINGILFILAILAIVALTEWVILKDYDPPKSDKPGVLHLR